MYLVARDHFRSRDKDGGHTIRSAVSKNLILRANFAAVCIIEAELLPIEVLRCGDTDFIRFFAPVTWVRKDYGTKCL